MYPQDDDYDRVSVEFKKSVINADEALELILEKMRQAKLEGLVPVYLSLEDCENGYVVRGSFNK